MNRSDFSSGKKTWKIACAKCSKFRGFCGCGYLSVGLTDDFVQTNWVVTPEGRRVETIGMVVANTEGITRYTMRYNNEPEERVEDEM